MPNESPFTEGDRVYCWYNPGRTGYITGRTYNQGDKASYQVDFHDGPMEYVAAYELRRDKKERLDPDWLIEQREFGGASDLRRNISHILLSGKLSSIVYSLDITNSDFYPHQFKPVFAFLESPSRGLLIADEVGLGKTIEAGLIWTELRARYDYRRVLVVCPAMLRDKWRDELRNRFGVEATILKAAELLTELQRTDNIHDGRGMICSMQSIRPPRDYKQSEYHAGVRYELAHYLEAQSSNEPIIDLVIIDEAHYMRNPGTQSARLGQMLRDVSENVLLLSATPINLKSDDLFHLLNIVDPETFAVPGFFPQVLQANEPLMKARELALDRNVDANSIRQHLNNAAKHYFIRGNLQLKHLIKTLDEPASVATVADRVRIADMIERVNLLRHVVNRTRKSEVIELNVVRRPDAYFVPLDPEGPERKFYNSVTSAIRQYAEEQGISHGFLLANPQRQVSSCMYAAAKYWSERASNANTSDANADMYGHILYEDMGIEYDAAADAAHVDGLSPLLSYLIDKVSPAAYLQQLRENDSKFREFHEVIGNYLQKHPEEKIVVFSYFRATLGYLKERLAETGISGQVLMGGMQESKHEIINRFRTDSSIKVLLSSEVASEGVDLQFCRAIVNYDLPWNPMKIEQRIGRLDRIGQQSDSIDILNLGYGDTIDQRIYAKLFERLNIFTRALGGMEAMLGEQITKLTDSLMSANLTPEQEEDRISQTAIAIENTRKAEEELEKNASNLIAHGGYILERVKTAHKRRKNITESDLLMYVRDYLKKHTREHEFHQPGSQENRIDIKLSARTAAELAEYNRTKKFRRTRLARGERVRCEFINKTKIAAGNLEQINQFHPLIRFISEKLGEEGFHPVIAAQLRRDANHAGADLPAGQYAFAIQKWGFRGLRDEEDMRVQVEHVDDVIRPLAAEDAWELLNSVRIHGSDWPEARSEASSLLLDKTRACHAALDHEFHVVRQHKDFENKDRVNLQIRSVEKHRDRLLETQKRVLENYRHRNQTQMIPATEGRINKITIRSEVQIAELERNIDIQPSKKQVCCGVLLLK